MSIRNGSRGPSVAVLPPHSRPRSNGPDVGSSDTSSLVEPTERLPQEYLSVSIEGKPALIGYDHEFLFLLRGSSRSVLTDPSRAFLRVPLSLVLHASFISDLDGGSLLVRLLSPPLQGSESSAPSFSLPFLKKPRPSPACMKPLTQEHFSSLAAQERSQRLQEQLEGPCSNLRLFRMEARVIQDSRDEDDVSAKAERWADQVMSYAYGEVKPFRRIKVLINPVGGPGKARQLYESRVRPIFEAALCKIDVSFTQHRMHGVELARDLDVDSYDAMAIMSGDGLLHEVLNGFAKRTDARKALRLPLAPIPTGSGNAAAINVLGVQQGFNLALACLNIIKGSPIGLDLLTVTQPASAFPPGTPIPGAPAQKRKKRTGQSTVDGSSRASQDATLIVDTPSRPFIRYYSFLSQAIGLMADIDLGTESMRALGDTRFLIGYAAGVLRNAECEVDIDVKLGLRGSKNKAEMRDRVRKFVTEGKHTSSTSGQSEPMPASGSNGVTSELSAGDEHKREVGEDDSATEWARDAFGNLRFPPEAEPPLRHGAVTDPLVSDGVPPAFDLTDPSWPHSIARKTSKARRTASAAGSVNRNGEADGSTGEEPDEDQTLGWFRIQEPIASLYGGKLPYVGRDLMQFPYALPGDGAIELALMIHGGGRASKIPEGDHAESGKVVYQKAIAYLKTEAFRVTPRFKEGDRRLKKGGMCSIDGEKVPYAPFQVEVAHGLSYSLLSLYGRFCVPVVEPPQVK